MCIRTKIMISYQSCVLASIPGRVFAFITVRRTTRPGTSCLRMRQPISPILANSIFSFTFVTFIFVYYRVLEVSSRLSLLVDSGMALS